MVVIRKKKMPLWFKIATITVVAAVFAGLWFLGRQEVDKEKKQREQENMPVIQQANDEDLVVYISGHYTSSNVTSDQAADSKYFTTRYSFGEFGSLAERWGSGYHMFYKGWSAYRREMDQELSITFFRSTNEMLKTALDMWEKGEGPDVLIGDYTQGEYSLYPYLEKGMFEDLAPYFEQDEIYTNGEYVSAVLEGGIVNDKQLIFPLTFNMNVILTSEERMKKHDLWISEDMNYEEILDLFIGEFGAVRSEDEHLLVQFTDGGRNFHPLALFQAASGERIVNYDTGRIVLDQESFEEWTALYRNYVCSQYGMDKEELKEMVRTQLKVVPPVTGSNYESLQDWPEDGVPTLDMFDIMQERIVCYAEGGNWSYDMHSFVANTQYFESRFSDNGEQFVCFGIPAKNNSAGYAAQITSFGTVLSGSDKAEEGYQLLKMLADTEHWQFSEMPVNRKTVEIMLNQATSIQYMFYPEIAHGLPPKNKEPQFISMLTEEAQAKKWYGDGYAIRPLSQESADYLLNMIDHIETANLPEYQLVEAVRKEMEEYIWGDTETMEQAYENAINLLEDMGYRR